MKYLVLVVTAISTYAQSSAYFPAHHIEEISSLSQLSQGDKFCFTHYNKQNGRERFLTESSNLVVTGGNFSFHDCMRGNARNQWKLVRLPLNEDYQFSTGAYASRICQLGTICQ